MGRKKKVVEVKEQAAIEYKSKVKIDLVKNGKVIRSINTHNTATSKLFGFLLDCLRGTYDNNNRPILAAVYNDDGFVTGPIAVANNNIIKDGNTLTYKVVIPNNSAAGMSFNVIALFATNESAYISDPSYYPTRASMYINLENPVAVQDEYDILVSWQISLSEKIQGE